jgi:hypothetical protein
MAVVAILSSAALAEASNFIVHGGAPGRGVAIAARAEQTRDRVSAILLGKPKPSEWTVPCQIHLHSTERSFVESVGGLPDAGRGGATSIEFSEDAVVLRRVDLMDDSSTDIPSALAHEIVHVVLADRFVDAPPPRWADEGLAILFDDDLTRQGHDQDFQVARRSGMTWSLAHLMTMEEYPREVHRQRVFYGQSASLVNWLVARRNEATLMAFLEDSASIGESAALQRHYGLDSVVALEGAWLATPPAIDVAVE